MKILYFTHTGIVGGAELCLLDLLDALPSGIDVAVACPDPSPLADQVRRRNFSVLPVTGTSGSLRMSVGPTSRALVDIARTGRQVRKLARHFDLVHANGIRAALIACAAVKRTPVVAHIHDRLPETLLPRAVTAFVARRSAAALFISAYTAEPFSRAKNGHVLFNPLDESRFDPRRFDRGRLRHELGFAGFTCALVAQITPWKGQIDAIEATAMLRRRGYDANLAIVGAAKFSAAATRHDNDRYLSELRERTQRSDVGSSVQFLGERSDVPEIISAADAILVPSWAEPFGRIAAEAQLMATPLIATCVGGPSEIVDDGVTGFLVPPRAPDRLADAIAELILHPERAESVGAAARARAVGRFDREAYAQKALRIYADTIASRDSANATAEAKPRA